MEYKCPSCTYLSDSITLLHVHCVNAHPKEFFTCPWCTVPFATLRVLQKHAPKCSALDKNEPREGEINTVLVNNDTCLVCEGRFNSAEVAIKHYKEQHLNFSYICDVCEMYFQHNSNLDIHYATSHGKPSVSLGVLVPPSEPVASRVDTNDEKFALAISKDSRNTIADDSTMKKEKRRTITISTAPSPKRGKFANTSGFYKRQSMQFFTELHCLHCKRDFANSAEIHEHYEIEHHTEVLACPKCNKAYTSKEKARKHFRDMPCQPKPDNVAKHPKRSRNNRKSMPLQTTADFESCYLCPYKATSHKLIQSHIAHQHSQLTLTRVKVENVGGFDVSSLMDQSIEMKKEAVLDNEQFLPNVKRVGPLTFAGYFDLTLDD